MSFGCRWAGELKPQVEAFLVSAIADPPTHRIATVVYDFPVLMRGSWKRSPVGDGSGLYRPGLPRGAR